MVGSYFLTIFARYESPLSSRIVFPNGVWEQAKAKFD